MEGEKKKSCMQVKPFWYLIHVPQQQKTIDLFAALSYSIDIFIIASSLDATSVYCFFFVVFFRKDLRWQDGSEGRYDGRERGGEGAMYNE